MEYDSSMQSTRQVQRSRLFVQMASVGPDICKSSPGRIEQKFPLNVGRKGGFVWRVFVESARSRTYSRYDSNACKFGQSIVLRLSIIAPLFTFCILYCRQDARNWETHGIEFFSSVCPLRNLFGIQLIMPLSLHEYMKYIL